jgi:predicted DNA-binding protein YlxM (UPF0122 family)
MLITHERNCVINPYYNQRDTTHEIARIEKISIRDIYAIIKGGERVETTEVQYQEISFKDYKLLFKEKRSVELVDLPYQYIASFLH